MIVFYFAVEYIGANSNESAKPCYGMQKYE